MIKWTTKNGKEIPVSDMELSHIKNTIAMLKRSKSEHKAIPLWITIFEKELKRRANPTDIKLNGEIAQMFVDMMEEQEFYPEDHYHHWHDL